MNGGTIQRVTGWKIGKMTGTGTIRKIVRVNGTTMKVPNLVCGVAGSNPSLNQQSKDKVKIDDRQWFAEHSLQRGLCERLRDR